MSILLLWTALGVSIYLVDILYIRVLLCVVGIGVTAHLVHIKTLENVLAATKRKYNSLSYDSNHTKYKINNEKKHEFITR